MYLLVTYDVATSSEGGTTRLRKVAKTCLDYGQRVQNSVFECEVNPAQMVALRQQLLQIIELDTDSVRFYFLGRNWRKRVEHHGSKASYDIDGFLGV